jgi:hypothetical protein
LADLWLAASDRAAVTAAANAIDGRLRNDPDTAGQPRGGVTRILVEPPLAVYFDVDEPNRMVTVWAVWRHTGTP